jgi:predicted PurR-regulated permease PerM
MRDFFLVMFLTFLLTYSVRSLVVFVLIRCFGFKYMPRLWEIISVVICFLVLLASIYGIGSFLGPRLVLQGQTLIKKLSSNDSNPTRIVDHILTRTVGEYLFRQQYGERGSTLYQEGLNQFKDPDRAALAFEKVMNDVVEAFDATLVTDQVLSDILVFTLNTKDELLFREWVFKHKAETILEADKDRFYNDWGLLYRSDEFKIPGLTNFENLTEEQKVDGVLHYVTNITLEEAHIRNQLVREWRREVVQEDANRLKVRNPLEYERRLGDFYERYHKENPITAPFEPDVFIKLRAARVLSKEALVLGLNALSMSDQGGASVSEQAIIAFENSERSRLMREWKKGELAARLQVAFEDKVLDVMTHTGKFVGDILPHLIGLPVQLGLILILSFLISIDMPHILRGLEKIRESRARWIFDELAPFSISFGRLIGRAFQAQGMIAIVNSILTIASIEFLGIENGAFLGGIVFICSFIPVLGVVLSSAPIAIIALVQDGGGVLLALASIGMVLIIHFIETSFLNPKILGDMLHLHPVLVLAILAISEHFFGVWGLLLGIPIVVYIIRFIILDEGIPGLIEPIRSKSASP